MTSKQIKIQTDLSYHTFIEYISQYGLELDPGCIDILRQAIESEVIKEMINQGEDSGNFLSITQYLADLRL